jgi:glucose/arabinose dehydrogenase/chitodextrinase
MSNLNWPIALAFAPDGRIFFVERLTGKIRIIENGTLLPTPFYTLTNTSTLGEQGLLGLALDPDFSTNPWVYAYHTFNDTVNGTTYNRIVRIHATGNLGDTLQVVLDRIPAAGIHNGGVIEFAPDKTLFAVVGENGDPALSQDLLSLNGKVLRMNRDGSVPADNPFVGNPNANGYIYTYGHRNMFGIAWHPVTGRIFLSENGPQCNDELNILEKGRNYGWGPNWFCGNPPTINDTNRDGPNPVLPIDWWTPTNAPTNLVVWGGSTFVRWYGDVFLGEFNTKSVRRIDLAPPNYDVVTGEQIVATVNNAVIGVEEGPDGALWFTTTDTIYRLVDTSVPPIASFTSTPAKPVVGQAVTFNGSSSQDPDFPNSTITSYAWDFGDGSLGSGVNVSHAYASFGTYTVTLTVTDSDKLKNTTTASILVYALPYADFTFGPAKPLEGGVVTFDASSSTDPDGTITAYHWDWGDGTASETDSSAVTDHLFSVWGVYSVTLTVTDVDGFTSSRRYSIYVYALPRASFNVSPPTPVSGESVLFNGSASNDPDGAIVSYSWTFGDGGAASGPVANHVFATYGDFHVTLDVTDTDGFSSSLTRLLAVGKPNAQPSAAFTASATVVNPGESVAFDASPSFDPDGMIVSYAWDFGDGSTGTGVHASHAYALPGRYIVALNVTDNNGTFDIATTSLRVNEPPVIVSTKPAPDVTIVAGQSVTLVVNATDPDGELLAYTWNVNGRYVGGGPTFVFTDPTVGTYSINATVSDGLAITSRTWTVTVRAAWWDSPIWILSGPAMSIGVLGVGWWLFRRQRRTL